MTKQYSRVSDAGIDSMTECISFLGKSSDRISRGRSCGVPSSSTDITDVVFSFFTSTLVFLLIVVTDEVLLVPFCNSFPCFPTVAAEGLSITRLDGLPYSFYFKLTTYSQYLFWTFSLLISSFSDKV